MMLASEKIQLLLDTLCVKLGICLPSAQRLQLIQYLPSNITAFVDAVFKAEGLNTQCIVDTFTGRFDCSGVTVQHDL